MAYCILARWTNNSGVSMLHTSTCLFLQVLCSPSPQCAEGQLPELLEMLPLPRDLRHLPGPVRGKRPLPCILRHVHDSSSAGCRCGCVVGQECVRPLDCGQGLFCSVTDPSNTPSCQASTCAYPHLHSATHMCAPAHPYACTHPSICMHPSVRMHAPAHTRPYACMHPFICMHPPAPVHMHDACTHLHPSICMHPPTPIHMHPSTPACTHPSIYTHPHPTHLSVIHMHAAMHLPIHMRAIGMHPPVHMHAPTCPYACTRLYMHAPARPYAPTNTEPYACTRPHSSICMHAPTRTHPHACTHPSICICPPAPIHMHASTRAAHMHMHPPAPVHMHAPPIHTPPPPSVSHMLRICSQPCPDPQDTHWFAHMWASPLPPTHTTTTTNAC